MISRGANMASERDKFEAWYKTTMDWLDDGVEGAQSRSQARRLAVQRGEPMPTFDAAPEGPAAGVVKELERRLERIRARGYLRGPDETAQDLADDNIELHALTHDAIAELRRLTK